MVTLGIIQAVLGATQFGLGIADSVNNKKLSEESAKLAEIQRGDEMKAAEDNRSIYREGQRQTDRKNTFNRDVADQDIDLLNRKEKQTESDADNSVFQQASSLFKTGGLRQSANNMKKTSLFDSVGSLNRGRV